MTDIIIPEGLEQATLRPYTKSYVAQVSQAGTSAPAASVLFENTVGTVTFSRTSVGQYKILGTFPLGKTVMPPFPSQSYGALLPLFFNVPGDQFYRLVQQTANEISIEFLDADGNFIEWSFTGAEILVNVIVYP